MFLFPVNRNFANFVQSVVARFGNHVVSQVTGIPSDVLEGWRLGEDHYYPQAEWLLYGFCINNQAFDLLGSYLPSFDRHSEFDMDAPPLGYKIAPPKNELIKRPKVIAGLEVDFPFGISASVLTRNSASIAFYAERGFDILTYKTVRTVKRDAHSKPNWVFVKPGSAKTITPPFNQPINVDPNPWPSDPFDVSMANSFGIPSQPPEVWKKDIEAAKKSLRKGQILIVSVVASPTPNDMSEHEITNDFVHVSKLAKEAGADIVEANYSCPNTPNDPTGFLYHDAEMSGRVSAAIKKEIGTTPLFVKIGYLDYDQLSKFVKNNRNYIQGIVAINTISMPVVKSEDQDEEVFPGRKYAGVSGALIKPWAMEVVKNLVDIRYELKAEKEFAIIGVGGVSTPQDVYEYLNLGVEAVESCTAAYLNPYLAIQTRLQLLGSQIKEVKPYKTSLKELSRMMLETPDIALQAGAVDELIRRIETARK